MVKRSNIAARVTPGSFDLYNIGTKIAQDTTAYNRVQFLSRHINLECGRVREGPHYFRP